MGKKRIKKIEAEKIEIKDRKKKKIRHKLTKGKAYIQSTYNNTLITITDLTGNVVVWSSAGSIGFKGPKKATPYAASLVARDIAKKVKETGLKEIDVYVKGIGSGRESAIRALNNEGLSVISIKDITPIPHNGCRARKVRRV